MADEEEVYPVPHTFLKDTLMSVSRYHDHYKQSIHNPEQFWDIQAKKYLSWFKPYQSVLTGSFVSHDVQWFEGGELNAAYNCIDRHLAERKNQPAIIWEGDDPDESFILTYQTLYEKVCRFANVLKQCGIKKGDRICIYLSMIPEAAIAMLASARIGAIHTVVFGGFSVEALQSRILDAGCTLIITANEGIRGNKAIPLKANVDEALKVCQAVHTTIVIKRTDAATDWSPDRDIWYHEAMDQANQDCEPESMSALDPLFILYTSGSTGAPKGILHGTGGYLLYAAMTHQLIFDYHHGEIYWCTADVGWITGHTYGVYGPLLNGGTTLLFEGVPNYPTPARFWEVIDKHKVNIFYTAPTAIRALHREGDEWLKSTTRETLRLLGTVGEPINPAAWNWYYHVVGKDRCPIVDTWWQTETGGIMISPLPGATPLKPGSAAWPFFGVKPKIVDEEGNEVPDGQLGYLVMTQPWPGMMQTVYGQEERFITTYFKKFPAYYLTGDQAHRDQEGYYWIHGRSDDVIKVSGHRIGTEEVESALVSHSAIAEAAVVAIPHDIKGQGIYAFVILKKGHVWHETLEKELIQAVRLHIGAIATPEYIQCVDALPKTRSGKIMRRLLRKIAAHDTDDLGDITTLADPEVMQTLLATQKKA